MTSTCNKCKKNYKVLTEEGLCYYCHVNKYGKPPTKGVWESGEQRAMNLGKKGGIKKK